MEEMMMNILILLGEPYNKIVSSVDVIAENIINPLTQTQTHSSSHWLIDWEMIFQFLDAVASLEPTQHKCHVPLQASSEILLVILLGKG